MKREPSPRKSQDHLDEMIEDVNAKQRNTLWPDAMINGRSVDEFLWKGSPDAPLVQRIGAWIFGLTFMLLGIGLVEIDREIEPYRKSLALVVLGVVCFWIGVKVFWNGFRRRKRGAPKVD